MRIVDHSWGFEMSRVKKIEGKELHPFLMSNFENCIFFSDLIPVIGAFKQMLD